MMVTGKTTGALKIDGTPSAAYSLTARALHWITAALVLTTIPLGVVIVNEWGGPLQDPLYDLHRSIGALLILVIIVRLGYRLTHPPLPLPDDIPPMQRVAARATHWALYGLLVVQPGTDADPVSGSRIVRSPLRGARIDWRGHRGPCGYAYRGRPLSSLRAPGPCSYAHDHGLTAAAPAERQTERLVEPSSLAGKTTRPLGPP